MLFSQASVRTMMVIQKTNVPVRFCVRVAVFETSLRPRQRRPGFGPRSNSPSAEMSQFAKTAEG